MDPRTTIPALALLGLSCTDCTDRGDNGSDPIVGEWLAVDIDGDAFPIVEDDERRGWALEITAEHRGDLAYYNEQVEDGLVNRYEYYSDLTVLDEQAPKYRITVKGDLSDAFGHDEYADGGVVTVTASDGGYDATSDTVGDTIGDTTAGDGGYTTGALDPDEHSFDEFELELGNPVHPQLAGTMILDCELAAEVLTCNRKPGLTDSGELKVWRFERQTDE